MPLKEEKPMGIRRTEKKTQSKRKGSNYHTRQTYLQAMKQFMADDINTAYPLPNGDIDQYFLYE